MKIYEYLSTFVFLLFSLFTQETNALKLVPVGSGGAAFLRDIDWSQFGYTWGTGREGFLASYRSSDNRVWWLSGSWQNCDRSRQTTIKLLQQQFDSNAMNYSDTESSYPYYTNYPKGLYIRCTRWTGADFEGYEMSIPSANIDIDNSCNLTAPVLIDFGEQAQESEAERSVQGRVSCRFSTNVLVSVDTGDGKLDLGRGLTANVYINNQLGHNTFRVNGPASFGLKVKLNKATVQPGVYEKAMIVHFELP